MNNNSKEELKGNEFNRLLLVPCEEKLLIGECAASAEYSVAAKPSVRKNGNHLSG